jgi:hypothetical protein
MPVSMLRRIMVPMVPSDQRSLAMMMRMMTTFFLFRHRGSQPRQLRSSSLERPDRSLVPRAPKSPSLRSLLEIPNYRRLKRIERRNYRNHLRLRESPLSPLNPIKSNKLARILRGCRFRQMICPCLDLTPGNSSPSTVTGMNLITYPDGYQSGSRLRRVERTNLVQVYTRVP